MALTRDQQKAIFSSRLNVKLNKINPKEKSFEIDSVSRPKAQEIFEKLNKTVTDKRPSAKSQTVMLAGGLHQTVWEDKRGRILLEAKFFDIPDNKVRITGRATKDLVKF